MFTERAVGCQVCRLPLRAFWNGFLRLAWIGLFRICRYGVTFGHSAVLTPLGTSSLVFGTLHHKKVS